MARKKTPQERRISGADRNHPDRKAVELFPQNTGEDYDLAPPRWFKATAKALWREKLELYRQRGQRISGAIHQLQQYVALEADIVDRRKKNLPVTAADLKTLRTFAADFCDTIPSNVVSASSASVMRADPDQDKELSWAMDQVRQNPFNAHKAPVRDILAKHGVRPQTIH